MVEPNPTREAAGARGLELLATGLSLQLWRFWLGTLAVVLFLGLVFASSQSGPGPAPGAGGGAPAPPLAFMVAGAAFALLAVAAVVLDLVGSLLCGLSQGPGRRGSVVAALLLDLAGAGAVSLLWVINRRNDLHLGMLACGVVTLLAAGESLFLGFLKAVAAGLENREAAGYASKTRRLWHVLTPMVLLTLVLATLDALGPGVFRVYLILALLPSLALAAWFWVRRAVTLLGVRGTVVARARRTA